MKTEIIKCNSKEDIQKLVDDWSLTWEGLMTDEESMDLMFDWIGKYTKVINRRVYLTSGSLMNKVFGLTGQNAYKDDLSIVSVKTEDVKDKNALAIPRFLTGGRWMYDIVENNARRESEMA